MSKVAEVLAKYSGLIERELRKLIPKQVDEEELEKILGKPIYRYEVESINKTVLEPFWDLLERGGKRWRPALMLMIYKALGGDPEEIAPLSIIPEAIHNGTLVVDDVEDNSDYRRGKPCIHKLYGVDVAINMGNTMYFLPLIWLTKSGIQERKKLRILEEYVRTMTELSLGQAMDIAWHRGLVESIDEEQYLQMTLFKTGALARFSAKIATIMAEADEHVEKSIEDFSESMAIAFQIQDDVLNIVGEIEKYGKEIGGDIKEGKRTLMVIHALNTLPREKAERLQQILDMRTEDDKLIREAINLIKESGAVEYAKEVSRRLALKAREELEKALPDSEAKEDLKTLIEFLISREY